MAKEASSANQSLPLQEVLEAEFKALHGERPLDSSTSTDPQNPLKALWIAVHGLEEKRAALCISGGGIRSATFGLGILQGLARCGLLDKFHYLSTVSGGGYIGSWLSAWIKNKNNPKGMEEVVKELNHPPDSTLDPEPPPIRHLRKFSNYLTPKTGLMSVDFWTLIATFIRNMFLNWLVLMSCLAAAMIIPRLYLASINVEPNWRDWKAPVVQYWNIGLTIVLAVGFALIAIAMAYAIIDVPSTGNLRYSQRLFLWFRQFPLFLASLFLAAWWAVFRNIHGSEPFQSKEWLPWFVGFTVLSYLSGGVLATVFLFFHKSVRKKWPRWPGRRSLLRLATIVLTAVFAGFCLWAMATQLFSVPRGREFELKSECKAILISSLQENPAPAARHLLEVTLPAGTQVEKIHGKGGTTGWKANQIPTWQEMTIREGDHALFATEDLDALKPIPVPAPATHGLKGGDHLLFETEDLDALKPIPVPAPAIHALKYVCFAPVLFLAVLMLVNFLFTGLASRVTKDEDREWWGRSAAWILITIFGWIIFNVVDLWGAQAIAATKKNQLQVFVGSPQLTETAKAILGAFGGVSGIAGALLVLQHKLGHKLGQKRGFQWLLVVVAVAFFLLLSIVISWVLVLIRSRSWMQSFVKWFYNVADLSFLSLPAWRVELFVAFFLTAVLVFFGILMGFLIDTNSFSLHATYRNRLIRAYLAASRVEDTRKENPFTGFDPKDDFELHELCSQKPLHVINATLNLVKGKELAWQERLAESFTMSPLHCGSSRVGYRPSAEYGKGISLGTAFAISGAAANPNMGYHSSPVVRFLMTLFNVRLGWWLGNPGKSGDKTWRQRGPRFSVGPLFSEAMGNTTDSYKYVNLSDGGHFENLGLYEMVLRRCHYIVVSDAGEDPECSFADLGEAVRKIRVDFGIPIEFEPMTIYPRSAGEKGHNCAIGRIRYSAVDPADVNGKNAPDGIIIYIKPACYGNEPRDIYEYFRGSETFPHESTADQFFSESQFESYRMLGAYTMEILCNECGGDFRRFTSEIFATHLGMKPPDWLAGLIQISPNATGATGAT